MWNLSKAGQKIVPLFSFRNFSCWQESLLHLISLVSINLIRKQSYISTRKTSVHITADLFVSVAWEACRAGGPQIAVRVLALEATFSGFACKFAIGISCVKGLTGPGWGVRCLNLAWL